MPTLPLQKNEIDELAALCLKNEQKLVFITDETGALLEGNDFFLRTLGYCADDLPSLFVWDVDIGVTKANWPEIWRDILSRTSFSFASYRITKDGTKIPVKVSKQTVSYKDRTYVLSCSEVISLAEKDGSLLPFFEEHYQTFIKNYQGIAYESTIDWVPVFFKGQVEEITGYVEDDFLAATPRWDEIIFPEDLERIMTYNNALRTVPWTKRDRKYRIIRKDGTLRWIHDIIQCIPDTTGSSLILFGSIVDITDTRKAEDALEESQQKYQNLVEHINEVIFTVDLEGRFTYLSPVVESLEGGFGYTADELTGRSFTEILHPDDIEWVVTNFHQTLAGHPETSEYRVIAKSGEVRWIHESGRAVTKDGDVIGYQGLVSDITKRKADHAKIEELMREQKEQLDIINKSPAVAFLWKAEENWSVEMVSDNVIQFGYTPEELLSGDILFSAMVHPDDLAMVGDEVEYNSENHNDTFKQIYRIIGKDQQVYWIEDFTEIRRNPGGEITHYQGIIHNITERKKAENALLESETKFREIFDKANDGIEILEMLDNGYPGRFIDVNEVACRMVQYTRDELLRIGPLEISTDCFSRPFDEIIREVQTTGHATFETEHRRKDGTIVPLEINTHSVTLLGKKVFLSVIRDITERKIAEKALLESEHRNEALIDAMPDMMFTISREGVFSNFRVSDSDVLAVPADQIIGKNIRDTGFTKESTDAIMHHIEEAIRTKTLQQFEYKLLFPKGARDFEARMVALSDDEVLAIVRDITESRQAERELQKLASIVRHSGELIALTTFDGRTIFLNEAGARMVGMTPEEAITHDMLDYIPEHLKEKVASELLPIWKEKGSWEGDLQYINHSTGKLVDVHTMIFSIKDPVTGEMLYLANVSLDTTERKKTEKALLEANKKLNLLSSITRHDIINQVAGAEMFVEVMEMEGNIAPDSKTAEDLKIVGEALKTIERQIVFTRDYQDLGVQSPEWFNVGTIVSGTVSDAHDAPTVDNQVQNLEVYADPLFEKVIYNLFDNAVRHGEKITTIRFTSEETPEGLKLICEDDGVGVPADVKEKIFNRQYFQHTGLGLFLSKEILSITGMIITETGIPGEGARFEILMPEGMWRKV